MSTFFDIVAVISFVYLLVTYPILCILLGYAFHESKEWKKEDTSEEVPE